ncbi:MAG: Stp1/IreP family PP2C-type Ser/Thr phosphatase [Clostridia bacterium]|nr:Stp1/IreP family PP2C-type Ser/Thr phosphatase [Clostridia bacterium]
MQVYGRTDKGRVRQNNQDAFVTGKLSDSVHFAVVCDGMGGANGGNVASSLAVKVITNRIVEGYRENMSLQSIHYMLESAIAAANVLVYDTAVSDPDLHGMGTTVVAVIVSGQDAVIAHIGDSRAYMIADDIRQLTRDHSVVWEMVEKGEITEAEARIHPNKNFITRALGVEEQVECEITDAEIPENGMLLVCTDGLTNMVENSEIARILKKLSPQDAVEKLIVSANMSGGSDNITACLFA